MRAAVATAFDRDDPLRGLEVADVPAGEPPAGWVPVRSVRRR